MAYSYEVKEGDGATVLFSFSFDYLDVTHVTVYVDAVEVTFTWINENTVSLSAAPALDAVVVIQRDTPKERVVDFQNASMLDEATLDYDAKQAIFIAQEAFDALNGVLSTDTADNKLDAEGKTIKNVAALEGDVVASLEAYEAAAEAARDAAITARNAAQLAETNAETAETNAETAETNAETAETNAAASAAAALVSENKAADWAEELEDVEVEAGKYSAKHWAAKAGDIVTGDHNHDDRYFTETEADARYMQDAAQAWDSVQRSTATTLSIVTGAIDWNLATASGYGKVTLTENVTINLPSNLVDGAVFFMRLIQDGTGGRTVSYNASISFGSEDAPVMPTTLSTGEMILGFTTNGTKVECWEVWRSE